MDRIQELQSLGFDKTREEFGDPRFRSIGCSQCEALVINGVPCHETGCPNAMHECFGCHATIPANRKYCTECI